MQNNPQTAREGLRTKVIDAVCFRPDITGHLEQFERIESLIADEVRRALLQEWRKACQDNWQCAIPEQYAIDRIKAHLTRSPDQTEGGGAL